MASVEQLFRAVFLTCVCVCVWSSSQERLQSLKQSIEFMSGLDLNAIKPGKTEEDGGTGLDQSRDGPGAFYASESSQSPSTPRSSTPYAPVYTASLVYHTQPPWSSTIHSIPRPLLYCLKAGSCIAVPVSSRKTRI